MRKQAGMQLICFHFGFQIQTTVFSLEGSGIFLGTVEKKKKCSFLCSEAGFSLPVAALPSQAAALAPRGAAGLGWWWPRGRRWETLPASDNPSPGLTLSGREIT